MGMYAALGISATGLAAERLRMDVIANNLANADSTNGVGDAYRRKVVQILQNQRPVRLQRSYAGAQHVIRRAVQICHPWRGVFVRAGQMQAIQAEQARPTGPGMCGKLSDCTSYRAIQFRQGRSHQIAQHANDREFVGHPDPPAEQPEHHTRPRNPRRHIP